MSPTSKTAPKKVTFAPFYGKNGEVLENPTDQLQDLRDQINDQHERIQDLEKEVKGLQEQIDHLKTQVKGLRESSNINRELIIEIDDQVTALRFSDHQAQDEHQTYSTEDEDQTWEVDYEPSEQEKSNYQNIWEFLTESVNDFDMDKDTSWDTYRNLIDYLDNQEDDDLDYDDVQNQKTHQEATKDFLRLAKKQGILTRRQHKRLIEKLPI
ncbi:hypothetical protein FRC10_005407 [Ceratobasidium sp. 414]|nr:hypothetical protein FRC10_005407 [Ceratobasidium sp. 414]